MRPRLANLITQHARGGFACSQLDRNVEPPVGTMPESEAVSMVTDSFFDRPQAAPLADPTPSGAMTLGADATTSGARVRTGGAR